MASPETPAKDDNSNDCSSIKAGLLIVRLRLQSLKNYRSSTRSDDLSEIVEY